MSQLIEFKCEHCGKRLKANEKLVGRTVPCPRCKAAIRVPDPPAAEDVALQMLEEPAKTETAESQGKPPEPAQSILALDGPAIEDIIQREQQAAEIKEENEVERRKRRPKKSEPAKAPAISQTKPERSDSERVGDPSSEPRLAEAADLGEYQLAAEAESVTPSQSVTSGTSKTVFDDDLPDLAPIDAEIPAPVPQPQTPGVDLGSLDELLPELEPVEETPKTSPVNTHLAAAMSEDPLAEIPEEHTEYRVVCTVCGTPQYVSPSAQGMMLKCPDCFVEFKAPPPPKGWKPKPAKEKVSTESPIFAQDFDSETENRAQAKQTESMLNKAATALDEDELEELYGSDFDTATFVQQTFGFLFDPVCVGLVFGYGIVAAGVFALFNFGADPDLEGYDRAYWFIGGVVAPLIGLLFLLPMISSGLAILEASANKQRRVGEWPGFNLFDNVGDLIAIAVALGVSVLPGFFIGYWLSTGFEPISGRVQIAGVMLSVLLLFPVFLLSILDNGSPFAPISGSILKSLAQAKESWAGYYLKIFCGYALVVLLWFILLGQGTVGMGVGGFLFPLTFFFTFHNLGALADQIGDHLSFEFAGSGVEDEQGAEAE